MRVSSNQIQQIAAVIDACFGNDAVVRLFGSRVDDSKKGGDIDLYVEVPEPVEWGVIAKAKRRLEDVMGIKVDLVVNDAGRRNDFPIVEIAKKTGVLLCRR